MRGRTIHVEAGDQQVMNALEDRVVDQPSGLRLGSDQTLYYRGAVIVAKDRASCIGVGAISIPERVQSGLVECGRVAPDEITLGLQVTALRLCVSVPVGHRPDAALSCRRQLQLVTLAGQELRELL